ncbi:NB-ARC domain-containing protein [Micromonospora sp. LH3U1]|uniref:NB-ARC domain-containing protein n=1 Tax=Micromonospora sp. LH3U1 TaxID=3018339 RepID=UPI00234A963C|nr:NB-ARC domain-containing protein [Micromonospora sp. LH3U1]WCN79443.1 NB-ARC domain-containing protein [Micromonospora sp. LH3U1]
MFADLMVRGLEAVVGAQLRRRDFDKRLRSAIDRAVLRYRTTYGRVDPTMVDLLLDHAPVLDLPTVADALREMVFFPARANDESKDAFTQAVIRFSTTTDDPRVDRAVAELVRCLRDELQHVPELQPSFALMYQQQQLEALRAIEAPVSPAPDSSSAVGSASLPHNLPHRTYHELVGRDEELATVVAKMAPSDRTWVVVIDGIGGVGKTSLALETANELMAGGPGKATFDAAVWVSAKRTMLTGHGINRREPELAVLRDLIEAIGTVLGRSEVVQLPLREQRSLVRELLSGPTRVLLVLDNLETIDDEQIVAFLRDLPQPAKAIVTSRHRIDVAFSLRLHGLPNDQAAQLIAAEAGRRGLVLTEAESASLTRKTGGVPLAIVWSLSLMDLGHPVHSVLRRLGSGHSDIAAFCFAESVRALEGTDALRVLAAIAMFEAPVDRELLGRAAGLGEDVIARDDAIQVLTQLSLVNLRDGSFSLLPLTRTYATQLMRDRPVLRDQVTGEWMKAMLAIAAEYQLPDPSWRDLVRLRTIGPHLQSAYRWARDADQIHNAFALAGAVLADLDSNGRWDDLLATCAEIESYAQAASAHHLVVHAAWYQNWIHGQRGEFELAWLALDRVEHLPMSPQERLRQLTCRAQTCRRERRFADAARYLDQARTLVSELDQPSSSVLVAHMVFEEGKLARDLENWDDAERAFRETSRVFDPEAAAQALADGQAPAYDVEWAVRVLGNLAVVEHRRGNLIAAAVLLERALASTREHGSVSNLATLLVRFADVELDLGRIDNAARTLAEARLLAGRLRMRGEIAECERLTAKHAALEP